MRLSPEDVLTRKQLEALDAQDPNRHRGNMEAARQMGISVSGLKQRRRRARQILIIAGLDPQWKKKRRKL